MSYKALYTAEDFGYEGKEFVLTKPFKILTDEAVAIARDIILFDQRLPQYCRFNDQTHEITTHKHAPNTNRLEKL